MIHSRTLQALEFGKIIERLAGLCCSEAGRGRATALAPLPDADAVSHAARLYDEASIWASQPCVNGKGGFSLASFPDVRDFLHTTQDERDHPRLGRNLDTEAFWALREMLRQAQSAREAINVADAPRIWPLLLDMALGTPLPEQLTAALCRCISDNALIKDESSPELFRLRGELRRLHQNCMRKVKDFALQYNMLPYLQDEFMTLSSDRYVLPLKANFKGRMQGIIHDWSQTGETCYFEPMFLVEINNRLQELKHEEREEEQKILCYLRDLLYAELPGTWAALELLAELDLLQAKRRLAELFDGRPIPLSPVEEGISLYEARHPLLALTRAVAKADAASNSASKASGKTSGKTSAAAAEPVRPLDIILRPGERVLVITGGNAGGKTVCLKTLGLLVAMTQSGLPVPAGKGSHMPFFTRMDAFIGDEQSLDDNVSTFTAQIDHLAKAWKHLDAGALVLLDEFGAGTDPAQGAALAQAVLDELLSKHTFVLAATHFPALKTYALTREGARAASMLFDPQSKKPLYKPAYDQVGASLALDVARGHGLSEDVLRRAEQYLLLDGGDTTVLLARLNDLAAEREKELVLLRSEQEKARRSAQDARDRLEKERAKLYEEVRGQAAELLRAWKEGRAGHKQALKEMSRLRASLAVANDPAEDATPQPEHFAEGQSVMHNVFNKRGIITDIDERRKRLRLDMNGVSLWAEMKDVRLPLSAGAAGSGGSGKSGGINKTVKSGKSSILDTPAATKTANSGAHAVLVRTTSEPAALSLDVRGMRADQALADVERFLDKALQVSFSEIEIIHGRGTGALRREIHAFLRGFPAVERFTLAPEDRGGDGMTIVTLK